MIERRCKVADTDAGALVETRDIAVMLVLVGIDDAVRRKTCRTAIRVMHDNDILDAEKMLRHRDRAERIDGPAAGDDDLEKRCRRCDLFTPANP